MNYTLSAKQKKVHDKDIPWWFMKSNEDFGCSVVPKIGDNFSVLKSDTK